MQVCEGNLMESDLLPAEEILILEQVALTQSDSTKAQSWRSSPTPQEFQVLTL